MNTLAITLFLACVIGSSLAQDCSAKIKDFHTCTETNHKTNEADGKSKFEAIKTQLDACYTDNGCTAPTRPEKSSPSPATQTEAGECRKALHEAIKQNFEACVKQAAPTFVFPQPEAGGQEKHFEGHHHRFNHKEDNKALSGCAKAQAVRDCKRALINSTRPSEDDMKARFTTGCAAKQTCLTALGADCQTQLETIKKAMCTCGQQQHAQAEQIRSALPACKDLQSPQPESEKENSNEKVRSCGDEKDYCKLGFDAMVADFKAKKESQH